MTKVKIGVIGVGNMGSSHIKNYLKGAMPEFIITAVADIKPDRLDWAKEQLPEVNTYSTASALMDSGDVDAVLVATPHYDHPPLVIEALNKDLGKSNVESYMCEVGLLLMHIKKAIKHLKKLMKPKKVHTEIFNFLAKSKILYDPYGVTLIISPWNYPLLLALDPLIGAISGGNTAIIKLSEYSVHTSKLLKSLINETFNKEYIYAYDGDASECSTILELPFDFIFYLFKYSYSIGLLDIFIFLDYKKISF